MFISFKFAVDIISALEFDKTGDHLATGDRGGRVVLFERTDMKEVWFQNIEGIYFIDTVSRFFISFCVFNLICSMVEIEEIWREQTTQVVDIQSFGTKLNFKAMNLRYLF